MRLKNEKIDMILNLKNSVGRLLYCKIVQCNLTTEFSCFFIKKYP